MPTKSSELDACENKLGELDSELDSEMLGNKLNSSTFTSYLNNNPIKKYFNYNRSENEISRIEPTFTLSNPYDFIKNRAQEENKHFKKGLKTNDNPHYKKTLHHNNNMNAYQHNTSNCNKNLFSHNVYPQNNTNGSYPHNNHNSNTFLKMNLKMNVMNCPSFYLNDKVVTQKMFNNAMENGMTQSNYTQMNYNDGVNYNFQLNNQVNFPIGPINNSYPINNNFNYQVMPQLTRGNMPMGNFNIPLKENESINHSFINGRNSKHNQTVHNFNININNSGKSPYMQQNEILSKANESRTQKQLTMLQKCKNLDIKNLAKLAPKIARDQAGCRFLQKKMDENPEIANSLIYAHVIESVADLMTDTFGNYLIQKLLEYINKEKLIQLMAIVRCT